MAHPDGGPVSRRAELLLAALALLALWLVFFAWPPVRPLAVFRAKAPGDKASSSVDVQSTADLRVPGNAAIALPAPVEEAGATNRERRAVPAPTPGRPARIRVHGSVLRDGLPVPDIDLLFVPAGAAGFAWEEWEFTDEAGNFTVLLAPGDYVVLNDEGGPWMANARIQGDEGSQRLDIDLPCGEIRGRVIRSETGEVVPGAVVHGLRSSASGTTSDDPSGGLALRGGDVRCAEDGTFELTGLRPGEHVLVAEHDDVLGVPTRVLVTSAPAEGVILTLRAGHPLRGTVRDPSGEPVSMDLLVVPGTHLTSLGHLGIAMEHYSGYDGAFVIDDLQPGPYVLIGRGETRTHDLALFATLDFGAGAEPLELVAQRCGFLTVTILRADGTPSAGAYLELRAHDGRPSAASAEWLEDGPLTDERGRIELSDVLPGWYRVAANRSGRRSLPKPVEVRSEATTHLELVLD